VIFIYWTIEISNKFSLLQINMEVKEVREFREVKEIREVR
jgi:hypothetical protein